MHEGITGREIILALAGRLPENLLRELFPHTEPAAIRESLRRFADSPETAPGKDDKRTTSADDGAAPSPPLLKHTQAGCMVYTDGASRGNPGEAGAGVVLLDQGGLELANRSIYLGRCTNNAAEYQALIAGLELALQYGCRELRIFLDSELIVRQVSGRYRVKNAQLQPLYDKVKTLLERLEKWQIHHVPRSGNTRADELANKGIDGRN